VGQLDFDDFVADSDFNNGAGVQAGNPDINPEQAWVAEAALEQRFWGKGAVVLTYRHFELKDVIDSAPVRAANGDVFDTPANIGDGTKDEFAVNLTLPLEKLGWKGAELRGSSTWRESKVSDPTTGRKREISGLRPLSWEAHLTHDLPKWKFNWGVDAYGAWRETYYRVDQITDVKLKTFVVLFAEWKPEPDLSIRTELSNLTERGLRRTRREFTGPRDASGLDFVDDRDIQFGRILYVRVRKTWG
jgi:outer membrane receptor protein involved in Fe transport